MEEEEEEEEVPDKSSFAKGGAGKEEAEDEGGGGGKHEIIVSASPPALRSPEARPPWLAGSGLRGTPDGPCTSCHALLHLCFRLKYLPSKHTWEPPSWWSKNHPEDLPYVVKYTAYPPLAAKRRPKCKKIGFML